VFGGFALADAAVNLSYVDFGPGGSACCLVPDGLGNLYVIGSVAGASGTNISVTRLDAANHVTGSFTFGGGGSNQPKAAALDPQGNLVIAGQTDSSDFPLEGPRYPSRPASELPGQRPLCCLSRSRPFPATTLPAPRRPRAPARFSDIWTLLIRRR
jgi:hypothetical protein